PDIVVFGKALTNGLNPLSGIWAREELIGPDKFPPGSTHSTFASNPLGTAVGLEVMKLVSETDFEARVNEKGAYFLDRLKTLQPSPQPRLQTVPTGAGEILGAHGYFERRGRHGVLLVHGVTGAPAEMRSITRALTRQNFTVACPVLAGHCTSVRALKATRWTDWYGSV